MRHAAKALALTAGALFSASTAFGAAVDGLTIDFPQSGAGNNVELVGGTTVIQFDVPAGQAGAGTIVDGNPINQAALIGLDSSGNVVSGVFLAIPAGAFSATPNYSNAAGNTDIQIDLSGVAGVSQDLPPFCTSYYTRTVGSLNIVGLRRAGYREHIPALKRAFELLFHSRLNNQTAATRIEGELGHDPLCAELVTFIRGSKRGITERTWPTVSRSS